MTKLCRTMLVTIAALSVFLGLGVAAPQDARAEPFTYVVYGESLGMSTTDGPWWDKCHHYVHFTYPGWMDGHIVSYSIESFDPLAMPGAWGSPSNGQLNAGYHNWSQPDCAEDTVHSAADFWMWITVDEGPF